MTLFLPPQSRTTRPLCFPHRPSHSPDPDSPQHIPRSRPSAFARSRPRLPICGLSTPITPPMACFTFAVLVLALAGQVAASPFQYPFGGLAATFSETLAPGACAGVFVGVETNFTCPCVTSESSVSLYWFWRDARDLTTLFRRRAPGSTAFLPQPIKWRPTAHLQFLRELVSMLCVLTGEQRAIGTHGKPTLIWDASQDL